MTFEELKLAPPLVQAVHEAGYTRPTAIQTAAIPYILAGRDLLGSAQTGTGKTAAFALPILHRLLSSADADQPARVRGARALVLCPTRELALQIHESFVTYGKNTPLRCAVLYGGVHQNSQVRELAGGVDILVATPGRLLDLMQQRFVRLTLVETVVLDEADRMLDIGFLPDIRRILAHIPEDRQALLLSATLPPAIVNLAKEILRKPVTIRTARVSAVAPRIDQSIHMVRGEDKPALLARLLSELPESRKLVFTRTRRGADKVASFLRRRGVRAMALHGDRTQAERTRVFSEFRSDHPPVLVATDIAARGLDVDDISHVFNFDLPPEAETYVHRIGRSARAGASGIAISFCSPEERPLLRDIERLVGQAIVRADGSVQEHADGGHASAGRGGHAGRGGGASGRRRSRRGGGRRGGRRAPAMAGA